MLTFIFLLCALFIGTKLVNSVKADSPEERYFRAFGTLVSAAREVTEVAFRRAFIKAKNPLAEIYRQLIVFEDRELSKEETKQRKKLKEDETKVLKNLKSLFDLASIFKPQEAKEIATELHIDVLIAPLVKPEAVVSGVNG